MISLSWLDARWVIHLINRFYTPFELSSDIGGKLCNPSNNQNLQNLGNLPSTLFLVTTIVQSNKEHDYCSFQLKLDYRLMSQAHTYSTLI